MTAVQPVDTSIPANDGYQLGATVYQPNADTRARKCATIICPDIGRNRGYYESLACYLAGQGFITVTFDYRGIGGSRPATLNKFNASFSCRSDVHFGGWPGYRIFMTTQPPN